MGNKPALEYVRPWGSLIAPGRREFDQAVDAEGGETDAMRRDTRGDGNYRLDRHPRDREPFEPKRLPDQRSTLDIRNAGGACRRSKVLRHCRKPLNKLNCRI